MKTLRVPIRWTDKHSIKYSLLLALAGYAGTIVLQIIYPNNAQVGLPDFWRAYSLIAAALGFLVPQILVLGKRILFLFLPRPGALTFDELTIRELSESFEFDRTRLAAAMVPDHIATATPAQNARQIDLGDAALILEEQQKSTIQQFIGHPKKFAPISNGANLERNVLMVTGEPGAGKSVLVQEIHATLSTGVEKGYHSFVPLLLFARDLTFQSLETLLNTQSPLQGLLIEHYKKLLVKDPMGSQLKALYQLVSGYWKVRDFLIIIDGLDEIAQRSAYEKIQTALVKMIQLDLGAEGTGTHRYMLTCRIDEDLEIFSKARGIRLRGLSPERREQFCASQLKRFHLPSATKNSLERALRSHRIVPSHVFARNPYFLALLIRHLTSDQDHVRQERIDFDFLMQRYLEREAVRPHAALKPNRQYTTAERHTLFNEMEQLSRAPLQLLAFRSAISAQTAALYDEKPIDADAFIIFCNNINCLEHSDAQTLWGTLKWFFSLVSIRSQTAETIINNPTTAGILNHLHENDVRIMAEVAQLVRSRPGSPAKLIRGVLGRIRVLGLAENEEWYEEFTARLSPLLRGLNPADQIKTLFFIRGIAAAHLLRILNVSLTSDSVRARFRHRRLAEYYAACYARDRWQEIQPTVALTPWISPVLNLTAALEGPRSLVLSWLVKLVESGPKLPLYQWRYVVESAIEASFFS
ncbi:MAG TPA: NACHT domain-containing protein, partial [Pyrinomonadaceae bacterium]|nr:NACHT domain-containing protein [Pyrinomonadaceae bacterium]